MKHMCVGHKISMTLVLVGALNWGLIGINGSWNVVHRLLGSWSMVERAVYILVGLAAVLMLFKAKCAKCHMGGDHECCKDKPASTPAM